MFAVVQDVFLVHWYREITRKIYNIIINRTPPINIFHLSCKFFLS